MQLARAVGGMEREMAAVWAHAWLAPSASTAPSSVLTNHFIVFLRMGIARTGFPRMVHRSPNPGSLQFIGWGGSPPSAPNQAFSTIRSGAVTNRYGGGTPS